MEIISQVQGLHAYSLRWQNWDVLFGGLEPLIQLVYTAEVYSDAVGVSLQQDESVAEVL